MTGPARFHGHAPLLASGRLPRLIAVDIDGTLLGADKLVSGRTRAAVAAIQELGVHVVVATGRPLRTALPVAEQIGATRTVVAYNGAAMWHGGRFQVVKELAPDATRETLRRLRRVAPGATLALEAPDGWFLDGRAGSAPAPGGNAAHLFRGGPPTAVGPLEGFLGSGPIKLLAVTDDAHPSQLAAGLSDLEVYTTWSLPFLLEVHHREVDKRAALERLCEELGIERAEVAAFGDQHNDSGMLAWAGLGVAMGNAEAEAMAAADLLTLSNVEDGVAVVLESWLRAASEVPA